MNAHRAADRVVIHRPDIDMSAAKFHIDTALGHCLEEFPNGSIIVTDLNTPPRIGDFASFGFRHELGLAGAVRFCKRVSYRQVEGRDVLVYEADHGMVLPLTPDLPILGVVYAVYIPAGAGRMTAKSREVDAIHRQTIAETAHIARRLNSGRRELQYVE
jgi:hypothetical protein